MRTKTSLACGALLMAGALAACSPGGTGGAPGGFAAIAALPTSTASPTPATALAAISSNVVNVELGSTSPTQMFIHLSSQVAPAGQVTFVIRNSDSMDHELVGFRTDTLAGAYPITSFEGETNRIDEDKAGEAVVDTGAALKPGTAQMLTVDMPSGHYAMVCNLPGHYAAGMHLDFWVVPKGSTPVLAALGDTSATQMYIHLSQTDAPSGKVSFIITNESASMDHELVGFRTDTLAGAYPITSFEGETNRIDEDKAGEAVVDTGAALKPGTAQMLTVDMPSGHYAMVCNLPGHYAAGMHLDFWVVPKGSTPVLAALGDTSATQMYIHLSQTDAPSGKVSFIITNESASMDHELVGFRTDTLAGAYPITSFEGETNRIDEDKAGEAVVDTGAALKPGTAQMLTVDMPSGHYAMVCNLPGHYAAGMHLDFWVVPKGSTPVLAALGDTSATQMYIHLSQTDAPSGKVSFIITNESASMDHELVGFRTDTLAGAYPITSFEGETNRIDEDKAGEAVVDTGAALKPGTAQMLTVDMPSGHYAMVCNLPGHYAAGMHLDFWVVPKGSTPVLAALGDTSATQMYIHLSQTDAPSGKVSFIITNESASMDHELVGFRTDTLAGAYPITSFEGETNRIDEDKAGEAVVDTGAALKPGTAQMLTVDMPSGHYAMVCNLPGHYAAGMHLDFWVVP